MRWHEHIHSDPRILAGKPVVRGTRLSVDFLLGLLAEGWSERDVLENYPQLSEEALRAMFTFATERTGTTWFTPSIIGNSVEAARERKPLECVVWPQNVGSIVVSAAELLPAGAD